MISLFRKRAETSIVLELKKNYILDSVVDDFKNDLDFTVELENSIKNEKLLEYFKTDGNLNDIMSNLQNMPGVSNMMNNMTAGGMPGLDPTMMAGLMSGLMGGATKKSNSKNLSLLPKNHPKRRGGNK